MSTSQQELSAMIIQNGTNPAEINARRQFYFLRNKLSDVLTKAETLKVAPVDRNELTILLAKFEGMTTVSNYNKTDQSILNEAVVQTRAFIVNLEKKGSSKLLNIMKSADIYNMLYPKTYPRIAPRVGLVVALLAIAGVVVLPILFPAIWVAVVALIATAFIVGAWNQVDTYLAKPSFNRSADLHPPEKEALLLNEHLAEEALKIVVPMRKRPGVLSNLITKEHTPWQPAFLNTFAALYGPASVLAANEDDSEEDDEDKDTEENDASSSNSKTDENAGVAAVAESAPETSSEQKEPDEQGDNDPVPVSGCILL